MINSHYNSIVEATRQDIFDTLNLENYSYSGRLDDCEFLSRLYDLETLPSTDHRHPTAAGDIARHRFFNDDWEHGWIFTDDRFGLLNAPDDEFLRFLVEMVHPVVQPDSVKSKWLVDIFNACLFDDGWEIVPKRKIAGRPVFIARRRAESTEPPPPTHERESSDETRKPMPSITPRSKVFISYSHSDLRWLKRLQIHLAPLEREGKLERWDDTRIRTSQNWREEIRRAIETAKVAVLLISADFLASDFIATNELPPLLAAAKEDGAFIMPVIISPCRFSATPSLSGFQAVNPPSSPLIGMRQHNREAIWLKLTNDIEDALSGKL